MLPFNYLRSLSQVRQPVPITLSRKTFSLRKTFDLHKALDIRKTLNLYKTFDIRKILLPLDGHSRTHGVSKAREDKAGRPILDIEEVTILLSTNTKG